MNEADEVFELVEGDNISWIYMVSYHVSYLYNNEKELSRTYPTVHVPLPFYINDL